MQAFRCCSGRCRRTQLTCRWLDSGLQVKCVRSLQMWAVIHPHDDTKQPSTIIPVPDTETGSVCDLTPRPCEKSQAEGTLPFLQIWKLRSREIQQLLSWCRVLVHQTLGAECLWWVTAPLGLFPSLRREVNGMVVWAHSEERDHAKTDTGKNPLLLP